MEDLHHYDDRVCINCTVYQPVLHALLAQLHARIQAALQIRCIAWVTISARHSQMIWLCHAGKATRPEIHYGTAYGCLLGRQGLLLQLVCNRVYASATFTTAWLLPSLQHFRQCHQYGSMLIHGDVH